MIWLLSWALLIAGWIVLWLGYPRVGVCLIAIFAVVQLGSFRHGAAIGAALAELLGAGARSFWLRILGARDGLSCRSPTVVFGLPEDFDESRFLGRTMRELKQELGPPTRKVSMDDGVRLLSWEGWQPKVIACLQHGKCVWAKADPNWHLRPSTEQEVMAKVADKDRFVGMTGSEIEEVLGTCTSTGSFDFGVEVWCWDVGSLRVEAWLREGCCNQFDVIS